VDPADPSDEEENRLVQRSTSRRRRVVALCEIIRGEEWVEEKENGCTALFITMTLFFPLSSVFVSLFFLTKDDSYMAEFLHECKAKI
jgi:hypothetical protein